MPPRNLVSAPFFWLVRAPFKLMLCVAMTVGLLSVASAASATPVLLSANLQGVASELSTVMQDYTGQGGYSNLAYSDGTWSADTLTPCWWGMDTAGIGAATLGDLDDNPSLQQIAITTFDTGISQHQASNGAFEDNSNSSLDQVDTVFVTSTLGIAYLELSKVLPASTRAAWSRSVADAANYLISSGANTYYINGNVNLHETEDFYLAYAITGKATYLADYENELSFTLSPSQARWPGYGLRITTQPTGVDGVGGAGYLSESSGSDAPGFDPNYTLAQLDLDDDLWVLTRNHEFLYLMNLEYDQLAPLINSSWVLNATNGSRDSFDESFMSDAVGLLYESGTRPDLAGHVAASQEEIDSTYAQSMQYPNLNYYRDLESTLSIALINVMWPDGLGKAAASTAAPKLKTPSAVSKTKTTVPTDAPAKPTAIATARRLAVDRAAAQLRDTAKKKR